MPEHFKVVCIPCKALYKCSALPFTFICQIYTIYGIILGIFPQAAAGQTRETFWWEHLS